MKTYVFAGILSACLVAGTARAQDNKAPIPRKSEIDRVTRQIQTLFKTEYARRERSVRVDLAKQFLEEANKLAGDPTQKFVLLTEARDLAAKGGDIELTFETISKIADNYDLATAEPPS